MADEGAFVPKLKDRFRRQFRQETGIDWQPYLYILPLALMFAMFMFYPLSKAFLMSFQAFPSLVQGEWVGFENYRIIFTDPVFWTSVKNTIIITLGRAALPITIALFWAVLIHRVLKGRESTFVRTVLFIPLVVPIVVGGILFSWIFANQGIANAFLLSLNLIDRPIRWLSSELAMLTIYSLAGWRYAGYYMVILLAGLQAIPEEVYESAKVQDISTWRRFRYITVPLLKPSLIIVTVLGLLGSIKGFAYVWVLTEGGPGHRTEVLSTYFYKETFHYFNFGMGAAIGWVMFAVSIGLSLIIVTRSD